MELMHKLCRQKTLEDTLTLFLLIYQVLVSLSQAASNYQEQVRVFKQFHGTIIGKGGNTLRRVSQGGKEEGEGTLRSVHNISVLLFCPAQIHMHDICIAILSGPDSYA